MNMKAIGLFALLFLIPVVSSGMTAISEKGTESQIVAPSTQQVDKKAGILLLSWQGDYLRTTAGTIFLDGVTVIDHIHIDKKALNTQKEHPEVKFILKNNRVIQVDIYPAR